MSLFSGLYTGSSGLVVNQNSLNTTAHNLANIGTAGYTRQQVTQGNRHYDTVGQSYVSAQQVGLGVAYSEVRAVRDIFLDQRYRLESGRSNYYSTSYNAIKEVETMFGEMEGVEFQTSLVELTRSVQELQKDPTNAANQGLLVSKAYSFIERAQAVYQGLAGYQDNLNAQIKDMVEKINDIGDKIHELNQAVIKIESSGIENANDIRDQRDKLLDELAGYGKISYKEDLHGAVTVQFEGADFISGDFVFHMGLLTGSEFNKKYEEEIKKGDMPEYDISFNVPVWTHLKDRPVISSREEISSDLDTDIGALKALVHARGNARGNYTDLGLSKKTGISAMAASGTQATDYNLYEFEFGDTGVVVRETGSYVPSALETIPFNNIRTADGSTLDSLKEGEYSFDVNGLTFTFTLEKDTTKEDLIASSLFLKAKKQDDGTFAVSGLNPVTDKSGVSPDAQAIYRNTERSTLMNVMAEFDNLVHGIVTGMNDILGGGIQLNYDKSDWEWVNGVNLFKQITRTDDYEELGNYEPHQNVRVDPLGDGTDGWSIMNVMVDPAVMRQPTLLCNGFILKGEGVPPDVDGTSANQDAADALADLFLQDNAGKLNPNTRGNLTFMEYYTALTGEYAIKGSIYKDITFNEETAVSTIDAQRQQVVGVSDNEELTNMIRFQNAYNANSRYINTISAMLDNLFGMMS